MRFNGKDVRDVHGRISVNSEILPGAAAREIEYVEGRAGAVAAGVRYKPDEYRARINIASFNRNEAREIRARPPQLLRLCLPKMAVPMSASSSASLSQSLQFPQLS